MLFCEYAFESSLAYSCGDSAGAVLCNRASAVDFLAVSGTVAACYNCVYIFYRMGFRRR